MQLLPCPCGRIAPNEVISANQVYRHFVCPDCGLVSAQRYARTTPSTRHESKDCPRAAVEWNRLVGFDRSKRLEFDPYPAEPFRHCSIKRYFLAVEFAAQLVGRGADYAHVHYTDDDFMAVTVIKEKRIFRIQSYKVFTVEEHGMNTDAYRPSFRHECDLHAHLAKQGVCAPAY